MADHYDDVVRRTVARHLGVEPEAVGPLDHLKRDLHLQPLDIVLIVLSLEDAERIALPIGHLHSIETVTGLATLLRRVGAPSRHAAAPAFVPIYRRARRVRRLLRRHQHV